MNGTAIPNTVCLKDENLHTNRPNDTAIPHAKISVTEIPQLGEETLNTAIP